MSAYVFGDTSENIVVESIFCKRDSKEKRPTEVLWVHKYNTAPTYDQ